MSLAAQEKQELEKFSVCRTHSWISDQYNPDKLVENLAETFSDKGSIPFTSTRIELGIYISHLTRKGDGIMVCLLALMVVLPQMRSALVKEKAWFFIPLRGGDEGDAERFRAEAVNPAKLPSPLRALIWLKGNLLLNSYH